MSSNCILFLTPGPFHVLFPVSGIFFPSYPPFCLSSFYLTLPMADPCEAYRPELGIKCSAKRLAHSRSSVNKRQA